MAKPVKTILLSTLLMAVGISAQADILEKNEAHFERITDLKNQLEVLELQKKIAELNGSIQERVVRPEPVQADRPVISDDIHAELLYVVNNGKSVKYTLMVNSNMMTLIPGESVSGWKLTATDDQILFKKGGRSVNVI